MARDLNKTGLLLVGHGTRDPRGREGFFELAGRLKRMLPGEPMELGFLEFARPTIGEAAQRLVERGVRRMTVMPLFLFAAGHVRRDVPAAVYQAVRRYPAVRADQLGHLGCHPKVVELSERRFREAIASRGEVPPIRALLLLVGRGSRDPRATAEMFQFAELRRRTAAVGRVETCFCAMASPLLAEALAKLGSLPVRRVVVQPHLLMPGFLVGGIRRTVRRFAESHPAAEWLVTEPLGPGPSLAEAVLRIVSTAYSAGEQVGAAERKVG